MIAGIPLIITLVITLILLNRANKKDGYKEEAKTLDKNQYPFRDLMIIGLNYVDKKGIETFKEKNKNIYEKMISMYGIDIEEYFRLHIANKITLGLIAINAIYFVVMANGTLSIMGILLGPIAGAGVYVFADSIQEEQFKKRSKEIKYAFPEFLTKLTLLLNAGLTVDRAWEMILNDSEDLNTPLNKELNKTFRDMRSNIPRVKCLNDLSRRCKVKEVSKFSSIILQNINKGSSDLAYMLQQLSDECWEERKNMAKQKGEEASTKLLFPMMLMLLTVFTIVLVPAMIQMFAL